MTGAVMWGEYLLHGLRVTVTQLWTDPFGRRMVRVEAGELADAMPEAEFLRLATPVA